MPRRTPREVYRVYDESEFLAGGTDKDEVGAAAAPRAGGRGRRVLVVTVTATVLGGLLGMVAVTGVRVLERAAAPGAGVPPSDPTRPASVSAAGAGASSAGQGAGASSAGQGAGGSSSAARPPSEQRPRRARNRAMQVIGHRRPRLSVPAGSLGTHPPTLAHIGQSQQSQAAVSGEAEFGFEQ